MGSAVEFDNGEDQAREVEDCRCPPGYIGFSCEVLQKKILAHMDSVKIHAHSLY